MGLSRQKYWSGVPLPSLLNMLLGLKSVSYFSVHFFPPPGGAREDQVTGTHRPDCRDQKEMATHSSVLAWRIPGTGEPGGLPSMGSHRVGHD